VELLTGGGEEAGGTGADRDQHQVVDSRGRAEGCVRAWLVFRGWWDFLSIVVQCGIAL
jgi:hypothetical protein